MNDAILNEEGQSSCSSSGFIHHYGYDRSSSSSSLSAKDRKCKNNQKSKKGVVLRTYMTSTKTDSKAVLNRTLLSDNTLYEEPILNYIPPIFFLIMYERTPYTRYISSNSEHIRRTTDIKDTEVVLKENNLLIGELLKEIDCVPDSMTNCFLRLEHAGSMQSMFTETFPTPPLRIGCLVRMTYKSLRKRFKALDFLSDNAASNSDLYVINYSSNCCITTVTKYLEPLFRHALEIQKLLWDDDSIAKRAEIADNGIFNVNFHLLDYAPKNKQREDEHDDNKPIFYIGSKDRAVTHHRTRTPIKEKPSCTSPLTAHDVRYFYRNSRFNGDKNGAASQMQSLPVVYIRHERDFFCTSASTEFEGRFILFHVYYVWSKNTADKFAELSAYTMECETYTVRSTVCDIFENRTAAYLKMLEDAKMCFWKKNMNTYIRLVIDSTKDDLLYSRFVLDALLTKGIASGKISLQSHIEGAKKYSTTDDGGTIEMFSNSITLDCCKLVADLDDGVSAFAALYKVNSQDAVTYTSADGATSLSSNVLASRQKRIGDMLLHFKMERIAELACNMACEMYLGVLDLYGNVNKNIRFFDPVLSYQFLHTLINESVYTSSTTFDADLHTLLKNNNAELDKLTPSPCAFYEAGIHHVREEKEIVEFDIESAYPTIVDTFNISPETTVIMSNMELSKVEKRLENTMISKDKGERFKLRRWCIVVPYVEKSDDELVIVSLVPTVYKGYAGKFFTSLVLKRRTNKNITAYFYKRLANRFIGCMGQKKSDAFAIHCLAAVMSLCKTIITRTLNSLGRSIKVLRTQTDGCLVQSSREVVEQLPEEIKRAFFTTISSLFNENTVDLSSPQSLLRLKVRSVNVCFIAGQTKYAIQYSDDKKLLKGHPAKFVPTAFAEKAVTEAVFAAIENMSLAGYEWNCREVICYVMESVRKRMACNGDINENGDDFYFTERIFPLENRREEEKLLDMKEFKYERQCRFGDSIALWPVIRIEGDAIVRAYVHRPERIHNRVIVDKFAILKNFINAWVLELCRNQCFDFSTDVQCVDNYTSIFYSKLREVGDSYVRDIYNGT